MSLERTDVYADPDDLALIKEIAARRGVPEAEIIREGIHLAAMSNRVWEDPLDWPTFEAPGEVATTDRLTRDVAKAADDRPSRLPDGSAPHAAPGLPPPAG